jgi:hypothetical protein
LAVKVLGGFWAKARFIWLLSLKGEIAGNARFIRERLGHWNHFGSGIIGAQDHDCPRDQCSDVVKPWVLAKSFRA